MYQVLRWLAVVGVVVAGLSGVVGCGGGSNTEAPVKYVERPAEPVVGKGKKNKAAVEPGQAKEIGGKLDPEK